MLAALIPALLPIFGDIINRVIPDKAEAARELAKIEATLLEQAHAGQMAQVELNKVEASHGSIFVAGWRPFIGWVGGAGLAWAFIVQPVANWALAIWAPGVTTPAIVTDNLFELVLAMLGLGGMRTFEKIRGVTVNMPGSVQPAAVARGAITADELNAASLARARR